MSDPIPKIVDTLLADGGENIRRYFVAPEGEKGDGRIWDKISKDDEASASRWIEKFRKSASGKTLDHDEPWVTLVAMYGLLGDQTNNGNPGTLSAINDLFHGVFDHRWDKPHSPLFEELIGIHLELNLPEILKYRSFLKETVFRDGPFHLYPDRWQVLKDKLGREKARLEGNTNLDILISGKSNGRDIHIFVEAKHVSVGGRTKRIY